MIQEVKTFIKIDWLNSICFFVGDSIMNKKSKKKKGKNLQSVSFLLFIASGVLCGAIISYCLNKFTQFNSTTKSLLYFSSLIMVFVASFVHTIIHEAGHLIFGLLSGYKFSSFRVFSFMILKEEGKFKFKRFSLAGTEGQCLMIPPDLVDGKVPVVWYNLGGCIINIIAAIIFAVVAFFLRTILFLSVVLWIFAIIGIAFAVVNGVPMRLGMIDNDGYNAYSLMRTPKAIKSFWITLRVNEQVARGVRFKDMPAEWFEVPEDEDMQNSMVASIGVFACNYLLDIKQFEEAKCLIDHLLSIDSGLADIYRKGLICERIYLELISEKSSEVIEELFTKEQKQFMKQMKRNPSIIRTEYIMALVWEKDMAKAEKTKIRFEKCIKYHPYQSDIQSERELIEIAEKINCAQQ